MVSRLPQYFGKIEEPFSQLLNVHDVSDIKQIEIHAAESLWTEPRVLDV